MAVLDADDGVLSPFMAVVAVTWIIWTHLISFSHVGIGVLFLFLETAPLIYVDLFVPVNVGSNARLHFFPKQLTFGVLNAAFMCPPLGLDAVSAFLGLSSVLSFILSCTGKAEALNKSLNFMYDFFQLFGVV